MKKSDMILIMSNNLQKHENIFRGYKNDSINLKCACDNLAIYLLKEIEKQGMLPPLNPQKIRMDMNHGTKIKCSWEPE